MASVTGHVYVCVCVWTVFATQPIQWIKILEVFYPVEHKHTSQSMRTFLRERKKEREEGEMKSERGGGWCFVENGRMHQEIKIPQVILSLSSFLCLAPNYPLPLTDIFTHKHTAIISLCYRQTGNPSGHVLLTVCVCGCVCWWSTSHRASLW